MKKYVGFRKAMYENAMTESIKMPATCNSCDRIIYEDENWREQYKENGGYCKDCDPSKEVKEGGEDWEVKPFRTVTGLKYSIVSHYDVIAKCDKEDDAILLAQSKNMYHALKAIVDNWDQHMIGDKEQLKKNIEHDIEYWSPSASMINSEHIANAREILLKATHKK